MIPFRHKHQTDNLAKLWQEFLSLLELLAQILGAVERLKFIAIKEKTRKSVSFVNLRLILVCFVGEKSHNSCSLDCDCERSLVLCAHTAHTTGKDFPFLGGVSFEFCNVLVVDIINVVDAERAHFLFGHSLGCAWCFNFFSHFLNSLKN